MRGESFVNDRGEIWGDLFPRYELARYDRGLINKIGSKALGLLDLITGSDVVELEYTTDEGVLKGRVLFEDDLSEEAA